MASGRLPRAWVTEVTLSVAAAAVLARRRHRSASLGLGPQQWRSLAADVVDGVLLALEHPESDETPLRDTVLDALRDPGVIQALERALPVLGEEPGPRGCRGFAPASCRPWPPPGRPQPSRLAWISTSDADALVDVIDDGGPHARIVISDTVPGGGGLVEALTRRLADDPRRFDTLVAAAVEPSDSEEVDPSLRRVLELLTTSAKVRTAAQQFRTAASGRLSAWQSLISCLAEEGVPRTHATMSALSARLFRPGSTLESDDLLRLALERWDDLDARAGFAIDHRAVCAFLAEGGRST